MNSTCIAIALALATNIAHAQSTASRCVPIERVQRWHAAPESASVNGRRVARTEDKLKLEFPNTRPSTGFYPGERFVVALGEQRIGTAIFDGCDVVPEWPDSTIGIPVARGTLIELFAGKSIPAKLRDSRGYRLLRFGR